MIYINTVSSTTFLDNITPTTLPLTTLQLYSSCLHMAHLQLLLLQQWADPLSEVRAGVLSGESALI